MRVLITGISGFIGGHLATRLAASGCELYGLAKDTVPCAAVAEVFETDLLDEKALSEVVAGVVPDVVVHLAGLSHVGESWELPGEYYRVNFIGTCNLLRAAGRSRVIFASSAEVYGAVPEDEQPIHEDRPLDPRTPYAMTKACAESVARQHGAIVVRAFNIVGVGQSRRFALPSFAAQLAAIGRGERPPVLRVGDLSARRDFVHVADAAAAYEVLIEKGDPGGIYNLASGEAWSIERALDHLRAISGVDTEVERDERRVRPMDVPVLSGDSQRLRALGWAPRRTLDRALREIWEAANGPG